MPSDKLVRQIRLVSGLLLMAFVISHLANLAFGLHSLAALETWRPRLLDPWRGALGLGLLGTAAILHAALGLYALAMRRSLVMSRTDLVQLLLGLLTPPMLLNHILATHAAGQVGPDFPHGYGQMLAVYWSFAPLYAFQQLFVVLIVWTHGALGLHSWLVLQPLWRRVKALVLPLLFALPVLALLGFAEAGNEVLEKLASDPAWKAAIQANIAAIAKVTSRLDALKPGLMTGYAALVLLAAGVMAMRMLRDRAEPVSVAYDDGQSASGRRGLSILEISRANHVAHAHVCSGRGRCGTCRVRVQAGAPSLSATQDLEDSTLARVGAGAGVRLACQARVLGPGVSVLRLLPAHADASAAREPLDWVAPEAAP
jgi:adenylate cyclase